MFSFLQQNEKCLFYNNHKNTFFLKQWSHIMDKLFDIKNNVNLTSCRAQLTHETYLWKKGIRNEFDLITVGVLSRTEVRWEWIASICSWSSMYTGTGADLAECLEKV